MKLLILSIIIAILYCVTAGGPQAYHNRRTVRVDFEILGNHAITGHMTQNLSHLTVDSYLELCGLESVQTIQMVSRIQDPFSAPADTNLHFNSETSEEYSTYTLDGGCMNVSRSQSNNPFFGSDLLDNVNGERVGYYYVVQIGGKDVAGGYMYVAGEESNFGSSSVSISRISEGLACKFSERPGYPTPIRGGIFFFQDDDGNLRIRYALQGLPTGDAPFHVHEFGSKNALNNGGHFIGNCTDCRPEGIKQEVAMLNNGTKIHTINGFAVGDFTDETATLAGLNGIVGRSIVIHHPDDSSNKIAQCQIVQTHHENPSSFLRFFGGIFTTYPFQFETVLQPTELAQHEIGGIIEYSQYGYYRYMMFGLKAGKNYTMHIHTNGNLCKGDASFTDGHWDGSCQTSKFFGITPTCRPSEFEQTVGYVNNGAFLNVEVSTGFASGTFYDSTSRTFEIENEDNGEYIAGRSFVVHEPNGARVLQGVVGIGAERSQNFEVRNPLSSAAAIVQIVGTAQNPNVRGFATFNYNGTNTTVNYNFSGLEQGEHGWHIHTLGATLDFATGKSVGGHFVGSAPDRGNETLNEVGLINNGKKLVADANGNSVGSFIDEHLAFTGQDNILGRSIVIHGLSGNRVGMGVIGLSSAEDIVGLNECYAPAANVQVTQKPTGTPTPTPQPEGETTSDITTTTISLIAMVLSIFFL